MPFRPSSSSTCMTRSRFLRLAAGAPALALAAQKPSGSPGQGRPHAVPALGSLMITMPHRADRSGEWQLLSVWNVDPGNSTWHLLSSGFHPVVLLSRDRTQLYASYGPFGKGEDHAAYLEVVDLANRRPPRGFPYPGPLGRRVRQVVLSADERWLHTLTDVPPQPNAASAQTSDEALYSGDLVVYDFDILRGTFLPAARRGPAVRDLRDVFLALSGVGCRIYDERRRMSWDLGPADAKEWRVGPIDHPGRCDCSGDTQHPAAAAVRCASTKQGFIIHRDGLVLPDVGYTHWIDGVPPSRYLFAPSMTADGKLLFVPTGERYNIAPFYGWAVDRVSVYETSHTFHKVRELILPEPCRAAATNADGSVLYALKTWSEIAVLDGTSLRRLGVLSLPPGEQRRLQAGLIETMTSVF
jgi:hypothetical protein